jgi:D-alanine transfer protein
MSFKPLRDTCLLLLICAVLTIAGVYGFDRYLDYEIEHLPYNPTVLHPYENEARDKGLAFRKRSLEHKDILLLGSSELEIHVPQNPIYMFPNTQAPWEISAGGRAYAQSLREAMYMGALPKEMMQGQKIVLITSVQWFSSPEIIKDGQQARFSELQYIKTLKNPSISKETKQYIARRMYVFLDGNSNFDRARYFTGLFISDKPWDKLQLTLMQPFIRGMEFYLELRDKLDTYRIIKAAPPYTKPPLKKIDWKTEYAKAEEQGKLSTTNNKFYAYNPYFDRWIKPNLYFVKGKSSKVDLLHGKEWDDLNCLLNLCKENGVTLYVVIMSTNGYYYDWTGMNKSMRDKFYKQLCGVLDKHGVQYLNLQDKEYEPYFYFDVMHLGWKGWLYVDEQFCKHFGKAQ